MLLISNENTRILKEIPTIVPTILLILHLVTDAWTAEEIFVSPRCHNCTIDCFNEAFRRTLHLPSTSIKAMLADRLLAVSIGIGRFTMRELFEGPNPVPDIRSPRDLAADIFSNQVNDYQRPGNSSKPVNDGDAANVINSALNTSSLYGDQHITTADRSQSQSTAPRDAQGQPPSLEESLHWAKDNMYRLDGNRDGGISSREINLANLGHRLSPHEQQMADVLLRNYEMLKLGNIDKFRLSKNPEGLDAISMKDIDKRLGKIELDRRFDENAQESRGVAERLMTGEPPLFEFLDQSKNGKVDGKISKEDLEKYMQRARYFQGSTSGPYSAENVQTVSRLLDTWDNDTFPSPGASLRGIVTMKDFADSHFGGYKYITYDSVAKAAGIA